VADEVPRFAGRVVDPSVAEQDDDVPVEQLSEEPPPASPGPRTPAPRAAAGPDEPALRPRTFPPMPASEVLLDPAASPPPVPEHRPRRAQASVLSPTMTAVFGALFGLAAIFAIFALLQRFHPHPSGPAGSSAVVAPTAPPRGSASAAAAAAELVPDIEEEPGIPGPWRIASLKDDDGVRIVEGAVGHDPLVGTLESKHIPRKEIFRVLAALKTFKVLDHPGRSSKYIVAFDRSANKIKAFELEVSPTEVYQARENEEQRLVGEKLDMKLATRRVIAGLRVGDDLAIDLKRAKLRDSVAEAVDRALDGRAHLSGMPKGATLRVVVVEQTALGRFASYEYVEALEYASNKDGAEPLRIYRVRDGNHWGYFDQKGKEPFRGGWRRPCPGSPVTSHFNPKRLHPILKIIKPHLGTDFGAPSGTPIHACYYGTVAQMGPSGPAGNLIVIKHPGDIESYYMHQSRFAPGLKLGDKVETFQIIGYVGTTGRSTGPHLHFGIKKKGEWIDPLSLKLDGERFISKDGREVFDKLRAELDPILEGIALPEAPEAAAATSPSSSSPEPESSAEPAQGEESEGLDELEPEGFTAPNDKPDPKHR
jgi:murein DD-endopeptidase MepM/ murein hydrolase activator NlpD